MLIKASPDSYSKYDNPFKREYVYFFLYLSHVKFSLFYVTTSLSPMLKNKTRFILKMIGACVPERRPLTIRGMLFLLA